MCRWILIFAVGTVMGCEVEKSDAADDRPAPAWSSEMQTIADGVNRLTFDLYKQVNVGQENLFLSPFSVHSALSMVCSGANGATREQMLKVLHLPSDRAQALAAGDLGRFYTGKVKKYQLNVANAVWAQSGYAWRPDFAPRLQDRFAAKFSDADFKADAEKPRKAINQWVEERTNNMIKDLMPAGSLDAQTRMVLVNAIYFKGDWQDTFKKDATRDQPFYKADGTESPVPLMHRAGRYNYGENDTFQMLEMPYKGGDLSMLVLLPKEKAGLQKLEKELTAESFSNWVSKMQMTREVRLYLPRFKLEMPQSIMLNTPLKALGMNEVFSPGQADLTGISDSRELYISGVFHKAFIDVNEEGTEAAAATGVGIRATSAVTQPPPTFRADRPFLFLIRDIKNGTILFLGRYVKP